MTTEELINRWLSGDRAAAEALYAAHSARVFRLAVGLLGNVEDAEEVTQDVMTYALLNAGRYDSQRARFSTWLHTITVSRVRDRQRRRRWRLSSLDEQPALVADAPPLDDALGQRQLNRAVWAAVRDLAPALREALVLRYWGGHSLREVAEIAGCPLGTAQSRVRRGYEQVRDRLDAADRALFEALP